MRKIPLKKNEIEMMQIVLCNEAFPTREYRMELCNMIEDLKAHWYKVKKKKIFVLVVESEVEEKNGE